MMKGTSSQMLRGYVCVTDAQSSHNINISNRIVRIKKIHRVRV